MTQLENNSLSSDMESNTTESGNRFGRGIEFREGVPIQLLKYNKTGNGNYGQIVLNPEALEILRAINEPLAIISVVGSYRRGKSWFANVLHGRHDGFDLGSKVEGCTRGIYMWTPPFKFESKQSDGKIIQKRVIVLDSEGIDDPKQDDNWATKLFLICLVVSSTFVYNINGIVGKDDIGKLYLMTDLSKFIKEPEGGDFLPRLVVLLRDFALETPESFKDYFLEKLNDVNPEIAKAISTFFCKEFGVYGLSPPGCKKKILQHMENAKTDELDEDFVNDVENTVKSIYSQLPLKYIGSSTMKGIAFVKFLEDIVERMNSAKTSSYLSIPSEYETVIQFVAKEATNEAIGKYRENMNLLVKEKGEFPMLWEIFEGIHDKCASEVRKLFFEKIIGNFTQIESFVEQLNEKLSEVKEEFTKRNSEELMSHNENIAKELWARYVNDGLTHENSFKSNEEFQKALESFELAYKKNSTKIKSPEAAKVFASYLKVQYPTAIEFMTKLGRMNAELAKAVRIKEEIERIQLEALVREEELHREIENQKREREETERNFKVKVLELQTNIEQQKKSQEEMQHRLTKERDLAIEKHNQELKKLQESMLEQQRNNEESKTKLIEQQQRLFEQIQSLLEQIKTNKEETQKELKQVRMAIKKNKSKNTDLIDVLRLGRECVNLWHQIDKQTLEPAYTDDIDVDID